LTIKRPKSSKNSFCGTSYFLKESLIEKKLENDPLDTIALFFVGVFMFFLLEKNLLLQTFLQ
jgi:hypothetical protein